MNHNEKLQHELHEAGATAEEIADLAPIANNLRHLRLTTISKPRRRAIRYFRIGAAYGLALGIICIVLSLNTLPGSALYPVQKLSDNVAVALHKNYRATVMMKRAQQVRSLVEKHADSPVVFATLADYQDEATTYTATSSNYAAFEYCKEMLQQAALLAPSDQRQAIDTTLAALKNV